jgi:hypothetical protein
MAGKVKRSMAEEHTTDRKLWKNKTVSMGISVDTQKNVIK